MTSATPLTAAEQAWVTDVQALSLTRYRAYCWQAHVLPNARGGD